MLTQTGYASTEPIVSGKELGMRLSVVVPCHNEEDTVLPLCAEITSAIQGTQWWGSFEIILIDDGSSDATAELIVKASEENPAVRGLILSRNFGKEGAMLAGLRETKGDYVAILDGDLQHPPSLLPKLLETAVDKEVDQVIAKRDRTGDKWLRTWISRLYYKGVNSLVDIDLEDGAGDFRVLSRRAVDALLSLNESNRFSKGLFSWIGFPTETVNYKNVERAAGKSSWSARTLINYGVDGVVSFNSKPLRVVIYVGLIILCAAFAYLVALLVRWAVFGVDTPGYITTIAVVTCLAGAQFLALGVIGEYVGRIYFEVKHRPAYIIKEKHGDLSE